MIGFVSSRSEWWERGNLLVLFNLLKKVFVWTELSEDIFKFERIFSESYRILCLVSIKNLLVCLRLDSSTDNEAFSIEK